jgi:hypothetical protein
VRGGKDERDVYRRVELSVVHSVPAVMQELAALFVPLDPCLVLAR